MAWPMTKKEWSKLHPRHPAGSKRGGKFKVTDSKTKASKTKRAKRPAQGSLF